MGKASSAKKVARAARTGVRSSKRRNLVFPGAIAAILVLGIALIVIAAGDRRSEADVRPILGDHWHAAYGFYVCDGFQPHLDTFEGRAGIHTHGDGVIHIHPFSSSGTGENATMSTFLEDADADLSDDTLRIGDDSWTEGEQTCGDEAAELVVAHWENVQTNDEDPEILDSDLGGIHFTEDGAGYTIAFVPAGTTDIPKPPTADNLAALGAVDAGGQVPAGGDEGAPPVEGGAGGQPEAPAEGDGGAPAGGDTGGAGDQPAGEGEGEGDGAGDGDTGAPAGGGDATSGG
ncbi:MAG TPA: hypothetical protein VFZ68_09405 [Acidimicrobiales bacterium]